MTIPGMTIDEMKLAVEAAKNKARALNIASDVKSIADDLAVINGSLKIDGLLFSTGGGKAVYVEGERGFLFIADGETIREFHDGPWVSRLGNIKAEVRQLRIAHEARESFRAAATEYEAFRPLESA